MVNIHWIIEHSKGIPAKYLLCFIDYTKDFDCVDNNKLENS